MRTARWKILQKYLGWWLPAMLVGLAVTLHWYRLPVDLFFGFEQGRDAMASMAIVKSGDFVLVGPKTDIGGLFHGAWYYYLMAIPYGLSGGNPLVASFSLVFLTAFVPVVMWFLGRELTGSTKWATVGAFLSIISYEAIHYSRWLSNVTPAFLGVPVVMWCWWQFRKTKQEWWWIVGAGVAGLTAQFEIILTLWFGWIAVVLLATQWLPKPSARAWLGSLAAAGFWYVPMLLFNLRNDWISWHSTLAYLNEANHQTGASSLSRSVVGYGQQLLRLTHRNLLGAADWRWWATLVVMVSGVIMAWRHKKSQPAILFCLAWWLMTAPVMLFPRSLSLPQLYIGTGLSVIWLWVLAIQAWWRPMWGKVVAMAAVAVLVSTWWPLWQNYSQNRDVFFRTIQDDLNLADQRRLLAYVHQDAAGQPYRLQAFSIPYFQDQGWRYLHSYWYPQATSDGAQIIYVVIEKAVEPFWIKKWTEELGPTQLLSTQTFGLLTVEKRTVLPSAE